MSAGINAIIEETEATLSRAKGLLQQPSYPRGPNDQVTNNSITLGDIQNGGAAMLRRDVAADLPNREGKKAADGRHRRQVHYKDRHKTSADHFVLGEHYVSGLPPAQSNPTAEFTKPALSGGVDDLKRETLQLRHITQQQSLEIQHMHKAMAAMQSQMETQRQTIAQLQSELLPLLASRSHGKSASSTALSEVQTSIRQLQQDVFNHLATRRNDEEQRKQRVDSVCNQLLCVKDTVSQDNTRARQDVEAIRLALDRHEAQLTAQLRESQDAAVQRASIQRAVHKAEHALHASREDLLSQMQAMRAGINDITANLTTQRLLHTNAAAAATGHLGDDILNQADNRHHLAHVGDGGNLRRLPNGKESGHQEHGVRHGGHLAHQTTTHPSRKTKRVASRANIATMRRQVGRQPYVSLQAESDGLAQQSDTSLLLDKISSSLCGSLQHLSATSGSSAMGTGKASESSQQLDSDFESLREEDDRLLAELERYSTPDLD